MEKSNADTTGRGCDRVVSDRQEIGTGEGKVGDRHDSRLDLERLDIARLDLGRLAHELRTPLSAIAVLSEIMRDERLGPLEEPRYRAYAADIHDSAGQAMSVLAGYLDCAATSNAAGMPMDYIELDIGWLTASAVSALVPLAERSGVALVAQLPSGLPHLIGDRRSVRQIIDNLIANAVKFTPPGGRVTVSLAYEVGGPMVLQVVDTGDGMTADELARAQTGAMAPEPARRRSGGTGYGLPLVRALASASGASLTIDSALGSGTRVGVVFTHDRLVPV